MIDKFSHSVKMWFPKYDTRVVFSKGAPAAVAIVEGKKTKISVIPRLDGRYTFLSQKKLSVVEKIDKKMITEMIENRLSLMREKKILTSKTVKKAHL